MITKAMVVLVPFSLFLLLFTAIGGLFQQIDSMLNYSMKRKIAIWPFKYLYIENRKEEVLGGPVLNNQKYGVYFPVFMLILIMFLTLLLSLTWALVLIFTECTKRQYLILLIASWAPAVLDLIVGGILYGVYQNKYEAHQLENINKFLKY